MSHATHLVQILRHYVHHTTWTRGDAYFQAGKVQHFEWDGPILEGRVGGSNGQMYSVVVEAHNARYNCSCPYADQYLCKHVVALALEAAEFERIGPLPPTAKSLPDLPLKLGMAAESLADIAQKHGLHSALQKPLHELGLPLDGAHKQWMKAQGQHKTLEAALLQPGVRPSRKGTKTIIPRRIQDLSLRWLNAMHKLRILAQTSSHLAEERREAPPIRPELLPLQARLLALRHAWQDKVEPGLFPDFDVDIELSPATRTIRLSFELSLLACPDGPSTVDIHLDPQHPTHLLRSQCRHDENTPCTTQLTAVDFLLDIIAHDSPFDHIDILTQMVTSPPWAIFLEKLEQIPDPEDKWPDGLDEEGRRLGWQVSLTDRIYPLLRPVLMRPFKRKAGMRIWLTSSQQIMESQVPTRQVDRDLTARFSDSWRGLEHLWRDGGPEVLDALGFLVGSDHVITDEGHPLEIREDKLELHWAETDAGGVEITMKLGNQRICQSELVQWLAFQVEHSPTLFTVTDDHSALVLTTLRDSQIRLLETLVQWPWIIPPEGKGPLLQRIAQLNRHMPVRLEGALRGRPIEGDWTPIVRLELLKAEGLGIALRYKPLEGGITVIPGQGDGLLYEVVDGERRFLERSFAQESESISALAAQWPEIDFDERWQGHVASIDEALELVFQLEQLKKDEPERLEVQWTGKRQHISRPAMGDDLRIKVQNKRDYFGLQGTLSVDGQDVSLQAVLAAIRGRKRFVQVKDGAWMQLSQSLVDKLGVATAPIRVAKNELQLPTLGAHGIEALDEFGATIEGSQKWVDVLTRLKEAQTLDPPLPETLRAELRPYQQVGLRWLQKMAHWSPGACLADDMGLGKTIQSLALLLHRVKDGPALIVAPTSVCFNWIDEANRFAPSLRLHNYRGRQREALLEDLGPGDGLVTSYALLTRDIEYLQDIPFGTIVLDEAQALKNASTGRSRATAKLDAAFILALSGTPIENRVGEVWSLFRIIAPGLLGSAQSFRERFVTPIEKHHDESAQTALANAIRPFLLRRLKREVALELPERTEEVVRVELSKKHMKLYDATRLHIAQNLGTGEDPSRVAIFAALTRMRQLACHPRLVDEHYQEGSAKLDTLLDLVDKIVQGGHKALIFSQFTGHLKLVRQAIQDLGITYTYLDGQTPAEARQKAVHRFQRDSTIPLFLISLKAGGTGLNLTAASYVIHLDPWWNPAVEDQATDRSHRIGQKQAVMVYRLISTGTIEEQIIELQKEKRELSDALLSGAGVASTLSTEQLLALIAHGEA